MNRLYYGDNLTIMRDHMKLGSVDLIYLDPPFNSNREYNAIYKDETGRPLPDQIEAFCDLWDLDEQRERALKAMPILMRETGIDDDVVNFWRMWINALRGTQPRLLAYLSYMVERLLYMKGILRPTGSIFLHCDPTASHYIKVMMDSIFGHENFRNEVIWKRSSAHSDAAQGGRRMGRIHDVLLYYTKTDQWTWNPQHTEYDRTYVERHYRHVEADTERRYRLDNLTGPGGAAKGNPEYEVMGVTRHWRYSRERMQELIDDGRVVQTAPGRVPAYKRYLDEMPGVLLQDMWTDINPAMGKERLGYATQKPIELLKRIIGLSTNPGDVVFDPFCGCATTMEAAHVLDREWIGIDIAIHAIKRVAQVRLRDRLGLTEGQDFTVEGVPRTPEGAQDLWERDKYHFQKWAVECVDGFVTSKRTADGGIDGRLYFDVPSEREFQSMVIEVKGGKHVTIADLRALHSVLEREEALMAGLIIMHPLGDTKRRNFARLIGEAGDIEIHGIQYSRVQILTVEDIFAGRRFVTPGAVARGSSQHPLALTTGE